ncbi:hypothetical protein RF11_06315 [Thelohanellus kitauei]|uniref:Uncharacterized protein n=1 Tax=Thelohanellus kitauei TaxID=669202 RepID=A0A0C2JFZ8_THEKT|nr:hypothetical protein RF11_06315 [Thelohanellus kitauei]
MSKRHVTDFWALVVFVVVLISMVIIVTFSIINSHPGRLFLPSNSDGEICGEHTKVNLAILDYSSLSVIKSLLSIYNQRQIVLSAHSVYAGFVLVLCRNMSYLGWGTDGGATFLPYTRFCN